MNDSQITALAKGMVPFVRECVAEAAAPLAARLAKLEARPTPDAGAIIRSALTAEGHKGGIDVVAPDDVSQEMMNAVAMLAEPFPTRAAASDSRPAAPKPRSFRFERDAQNRIVAAFEEIEG